MYKTQRRIALFAINLLSVLAFIYIAVNLAPQTKLTDYKTYSNIFPIVVTALLFAILLFTSITLFENARGRIEKKSMENGATLFLTKFIERLRFCYSLEDFTSAVSEILELEADCSVLYIDRNANYVLYNSSNKFTNDPKILAKLEQNYTAEWHDPINFIGDSLGLVENRNKARGFFFASDGEQFYVFNRYTYLFDSEIYEKFYEEFVRFQNRSRIISSLSEISELSTEWQQLADAQISFLPKKMPEIKNLKLGAYFRPLINVSGDYYTVLPIDENKTLLMLGDVSGKGLAAALVMGLVMNTVKIKENKEDLVGMIISVDAAIKGMHLQDKYTVLFIGIVDTEKMKITYVNASMSDPIIVTRSPEGYRIKSLSSNCSVVGIIPIDESDVQVSEQRLFSGDLIMMASDGVSEVMNEDKVELGDTELFTDTIKASASKDPQDFVKDIVNLVLSYNADTRLHDDLTMLVAKVER
ncbi:MAG: SpoIIE family protein phosphatase [Treponema sp.]|uniref:PP2C family protein-serine/threonine phosphatase n=1 Tax=Treponema sp. TaxID=166 RepID=UPI0025CFBA05|nr:SpoIIE family protein phosphatase [Treponema sp.]MBQ8680230.1 SpoIIE family protein phosphatase [Treponema sp.]